MNRLTILGFVFILNCSLQSPLVCQVADDSLKLEGISYEKKNPKESIAVINGEFLKAGQTYRNIKVLEVMPGAVKILDQTQNTLRTLKVVEDKPTPKAVEEASPALPQEQAKPEEKKKPFGFNWNPFEMLNIAKDVEMLADMRKLHTMGSAYLAQESSSQQLTFDELLKMCSLQHAFKGNERNGCRFSIKVTGEGLELYVDPIQDADKKNHFLIDDRGNLHAELGKPAIKNSPPYVSPAEKMMMGK